MENQILPVAPNNDTYTGQNFTFPANTVARFIAIRVDSYQGTGAGIGLGKVRIDGTLLLDTSAPVAAVLSPADNATNVNLTSNLSMTFNEPVLAGTGTITIRRAIDTSIVESFDVATSPRVTINSTQVTIDPTADLQASTEFYVQIDAGTFKDSANNPYAGIANETSWNFTTDSTVPTLVSRVPADDATLVSTTSSFSATFSENIKVGTGNVVLKRLSDDSIVETFDVTSPDGISITNNVLTIDPFSNLVIGTAYYIEIAPTAITDIAGLAFAGISGNTAWNFSTDNVAPVRQSVSPATPTLADPLTRLMLEFDEPMRIGNGNVMIYRTSDNALIETIDINVGGAVNGRFASIARSVPLVAGTEYYVNMQEGVFEDLSENLAPAITGTSAWRFSVTSAVPIVLENFSASSSTLGDSSADVFDAAIVTAGGSGTWNASTVFLQNGTLLGGNGSASLNLGNFINNAKGTASGKFALTMTMSETSGGWVSMGFALGNTPSTAENFVSFNGVGTIIYRGQEGITSPNTNGELDMFGGINNTNAVDGLDLQTGFRTLTATLDFTPTGGYNGTTNFGTVSWSDSVLGQLGSYTYTVARNFNSLAISQVASGSINSLALYQIASTNTYANWISGFNVSTFTAAGDDADGDGLANAIENFLGTSPAVGNQGLTSVSSAAGNLVFRHSRSGTPASDVTASYEWSTDLMQWNASGASSGGATITFGSPTMITPGTPEVVQVTATVTAGVAPAKVFGRLKVVKN